VGSDNVPGRREGQPRHARTGGRGQTVGAFILLGIFVLEGVARLMTGFSSLGDKHGGISSGWGQVSLGVIFLAAAPLAILIGVVNKRRSRRRAALAASGERPTNA
jgi:hypothetical protein